jgi:hypothetical protein
VTKLINSRYLFGLFRAACYATVLCGAISLAFAASIFDGPDGPQLSFIALIFFGSVLVQSGLLMAPTALASGRNWALVLCILAMLPPYAFICLNLWPCVSPASYTCQSNTFQVAVVGGFAIYTAALVVLAAEIWRRPRAVV